MLGTKNTQGKKFVLGQFFTPPHICKEIVARLSVRPDDILIEPSCGSGNFLSALAHLENPKIGIEFDSEVFPRRLAIPNLDLRNMNFYDFSLTTHRRLVFIGNPPFRTPAFSLRTHKAYISKLTKKYGVLGIREEAVFFILHTLDLIRRNDVEGEIHYILPTAILKNNSKFFTNFKRFLLRTCEVSRIDTVESAAFEGVAQDLVCLSLRVPRVTNDSLLADPDGLFSAFATATPQLPRTAPINGSEALLEDYFCLSADDEIPFQRIFKRTYLGSVPCESLLMSIEGEPLVHFQQRLRSIIEDRQIDVDQLYDRLQYHGVFHLKLFSQPRESQAVERKLEIVLSYVRNIQAKEGILEAFADLDNYKEITVRDGSSRYYFRCERLKKGKNFVYELNPNPCKSFYFTGNPSHSSTDYFGFCDYDINRNVSPGANRTVPVEGLEDNLTDEFKQWWRSNTDEPFSEVFAYLIYISKTPWYKDKKRANKRFYFSIPRGFVPLQERKTARCV